MMRDFVKKVLSLFALIILAVYTESSMRLGSWKDTIFLWELVLLTGLICLVQLVMNKFKSNYYIVELIAEYLMVCIMVSLSGLIFGWFRLSYLWHVLLYVTPVYIIGYFLDFSRTKRDVDFINEKIKQRAERGKRNEQSDDSR